MKKLFTVFIIALCSQMALAQQISKQKLDSLLSLLSQNDKFMGSIAISHKGNLIYSQAAGYENIANKTLASTETRYRIGSISKTFTAVLVLLAVEEGKLKLNSKLKKYFPKVTNAKKITLEMLLNHRSGIHNVTDVADYLSWNTKKHSQEELLKRILDGGSDFEPDSKMSYSNSNFILLTWILEKVYGSSYADLVKKRIVEPLGLKNTYVGEAIKPANKEAKSYRFLSSWEADPETDMSVPLGAGNMVSTPSDLCIFAREVFVGKLLKPETRLKMKALKDNFGLGCFGMPYGTELGLGHTGGIDAFSSIMIYFQDSELCVSLCCNGSNYSINKILLAALDNFHGKEIQFPNLTQYAYSKQELEAYAGVYTSAALGVELTVMVEGNKLKAQLTKQPAFLLDSYQKGVFVFEAVGAALTFMLEEKKVQLKQNGQSFDFLRK